MAGVYAAWDTHVDEWRAVKVLFPKHARDRSLRTRFENEAETMQRLSHPNLVRVFDVGDREKLPYMVMELVSAGSLYRWTKTHGPMPARMAVETMLQLCNGVEAVHQLGIVHRDIKPRNVLINWDGVLKLTDFGIAQLQESQETRTGLAMGTLGFMSPEQLHDAKSVDERTDIYALGATLWAQVTARKARDLFRLEDKPSLMDGIAPSLQAVLRKALAYEREARHPNAASLRTALEGILRELPVDPPDAPPLALNLGPLSLKSKPDHTFSEILTISRDDSHVSITGSSVGDTDDTGFTQPPLRGDSLYDMPPLDTKPDSAAKVLMADDGPLPGYMVGVAQPNARHEPEVIGHLEPSEMGIVDAPEIKRRSRIWYILSAILLTPVALVLGAAATVGIVATIGWSRVTSAADATKVARRALEESVEVSKPLFEDIDALGAESAPVRAAHSAFLRADLGPDRVSLAVNFVAIAHAVTGPHLTTLGRSGHEEEVVRQRMTRLIEARDAHAVQLQRWYDAAATGPGQLAVSIDLVEAPWILSGVDP